MDKQKGFMKTLEVTPGQKEEIQFLSHNLARKLIVPQTGKRKFQGLINQEKLIQLQSNSIRNLKEEEKAKIDEEIKKKEKCQVEQEARKALFKEWDDIRKKNEEKNELEKESKLQMELVLEKANEMIKEQNEEMKEINKLILCAKVQAIRDAQIIEKENIQKKQTKAENDLEKLVEQRRKEGILKDKEMAEARKEASHLASLKLQEQVRENYEKKLIEEEKKIKEREVLLKKLKDDQMQDYQEMEAKRLQKKKFFEELANENEEIRKRKQKIKEQSEKEDKIIAEYQRLQEVN